jgi:hypothetical protein
MKIVLCIFLCIAAVNMALGVCVHVLVVCLGASLDGDRMRVELGFWDMISCGVVG